MTIRRWWARQLWGVAQTPNETDDLAEQNKRISTQLIVAMMDIATLQEANAAQAVTIATLTERVELAEYMRDIVGQCRDDAYVAMARDSVP